MPEPRSPAPPCVRCGETDAEKNAEIKSPMAGAGGSASLGAIDAQICAALEELRRIEGIAAGPDGATADLQSSMCAATHRARVSRARACALISARTTQHESRRAAERRASGGLLTQRPAHSDGAPHRVYRQRALAERILGRARRRCALSLPRDAREDGGDTRVGGRAASAGRGGGLRAAAPWRDAARRH